MYPAVVRVAVFEIFLNFVKVVAPSSMNNGKMHAMYLPTIL